MDDYLSFMLMKSCWYDSSSCTKKMGQENGVTAGFMKTWHT